MAENAPPVPDNVSKMARNKSAWTQNWRDRFLALEAQARRRGFDVVVTRKLPVPAAQLGVVDLDDRVIWLSAWMSPNRACSTLAHEIGHIDVDENLSMPMTAGGWHKSAPGRPVRHVIVDVIVDEVRAWDAAYHIAHEAGVPTDGWDRHRAWALLRYARRAAHQTRRCKARPRVVN